MHRLIEQFKHGVADYADGARLIREHNLERYFFAPAIIASVFLVVLLGGAGFLAADISQFLIAIYPFDVGAGVVATLAASLGFVATVAVGGLFLKNITLALSSPFMSMLSERLEGALRPEYKARAFSWRQFWGDLYRGIRLGLRSLVRELFYTTLLFLFGLIPVLSPFAAAALFLMQAYYAGVAGFDYTLERHGTISETIAFAKAHRWYAVGSGTVFLLLMYTGIGFLIALPLATAANVRFVLEQQVVDIR